MFIFVLIITPTETNLSVGVLNVVVRHNHEENGNRYAKVTKQAPDLMKTNNAKHFC